MEVKKRINEWAIVVGGSSGLGRAAAISLAQDGYSLIIVHRDRKSFSSEIEKLKTEIQSLGVDVLFYNKDGTQSEIVEEILQDAFPLSSCLPRERGQGKKGIIKALIFSISKGNLGGLLTGEKRLTLGDFQQTINSMALSWLNWVHQLTEQKLWAPSAVTIAFTSEGRNKVWPGYSAVAASKAVLEVLMQTIAVEGGSIGLRANLIQAGITDTRSLSLIPNSGELLDYNEKRNPLGRNTRPQDIGKVVRFMCSEEGAWINGEIITVDGGEKNLG